MDLLKDNIKKLYTRYLFSAFGSAIICSIYSTVDMICVGQYAGTTGSAALSLIMPLWSIIISLGIFLGLGGAVNMGVERGRGDEKAAERYFSASLISAAVLTVILTALLVIFLNPLLRAFGANDELLPYCAEYAINIAWATPAFLMGQVLIAFVRSDGAPGLATASVVTGGVINIILDVFLVFTCDMGLAGAGLATAIGQYVGVLILLSYFFMKKCKLRVAKPSGFSGTFKKIASVGFSPFLVDISFGVTVMFFNKQLMRLLGSNELAIFGVIANVQILLMTMFYGVGQAVSPITSANFGAGQLKRVKYVLTRALMTALIMGAAFCALAILLPEQITGLYMDASADVLALTPAIYLKHAPAFLFMGIGIVASYYLQSVLQTGRSLVISLMRGLGLTTVMIFALPAIFGADAIWFAYSLTELITAAVAMMFILRDREVIKAY